MGVTALCIRLLMLMMLVLVDAEVDHNDSIHNFAFPRVVPDKPVFIEYENFSVSCEHVRGSSEWRVMKKLKTAPTISSNWNTSAPSYNIHPAMERDSGQYWCENEAGQRSSVVNVTVTESYVILDIHPRPVMEGDNMTLHCRNRENQNQSHVADFYKDNEELQFYGSFGTIENVSKSDEGLYKCNISGLGESPEIWLAVLKKSEDVPEDPHLPHSQPHNDLTILWIAAAILPVTLLLLLLGLYLYKKHKVSEESGVINSQHATYATVQEQRRGEVSEESDVINSQHSTYATVQEQRRGEVSGGEDVTYAVIDKETHKGKKALRGDTKSCLSEENMTYSLLAFQVTNT